MKNIIRNAVIIAIIISTAQFAGLVTAGTDNPDERKMPLTNQPSGDDADQSPSADAESTTEAPADDDSPPATAGFPGQNKIFIQSFEPFGKKQPAREFAWLGLAVEESSEALSSQLGLKPGEGLTVNFIATDSPAAKADFRKNDVLVELDGQMLVHPMQLRKLVQMHAEGDTISLTFYRRGEKQTASVKLAKTSSAQAPDQEDGSSPNYFQNLRLRLDGLNDKLRSEADSLSRAGLDKARMNIDIERTLQQTRKAVEDSVRRAATDQKSLAELNHTLNAVARKGVDADDDATITVRKQRNSKKTIVQTDENGTIIIETGAKKHLTARDKDGGLLFDGDIDTPTEKEKVPKAVWERVKPMLE